MTDKPAESGPSGSSVPGHGGQPDPFSREGSADQPTPEATPPAQSWPSYPPTAGGPQSAPSANPAPPGYDAQPTPPYPNYGTSYETPAAAGPYGGGQPNPYEAQAPRGYPASPYQQPNPYQPAYGGYTPYGVVPSQHPKATQAMVFGIIGLVLAFSCIIGGYLGIAGIVLGRKAKAEIDAEPQRYTGRTQASVGFGLGLAAVILATLFILIVVIAIAADPSITG